MNVMPIFLCVDESAESEQASKLLTDNGFSFEEVRSPHVRGPILYAPEGSFRRLEGIRMYVAIAHHARAALSLETPDKVHMAGA